MFAFDPLRRLAVGACGDLQRGNSHNHLGDLVTAMAPLSLFPTAGFLAVERSEKRSAEGGEDSFERFNVVFAEIASVGARSQQQPSVAAADWRTQSAFQRKPARRSIDLAYRHAVRSDGNIPQNEGRGRGVNRVDNPLQGCTSDLRGCPVRRNFGQ